MMRRGEGKEKREREERKEGKSEGAELIPIFQVSLSNAGLCNSLRSAENRCGGRSRIFDKGLHAGDSTDDSSNSSSGQ